MFYTGDPLSEERLQAFQDGWNESGSSKEPDLYRFSSMDDRSIIDRFRSAVPEDEEVTAAVFAGPLSIDIMDALVSRKCRFIGENLLQWPSLEYNTAASIEISPDDLLLGAAELFGPDDSVTQNVIEAEFILKENL